MKFAGFENERKRVFLVWVLNLVPVLGLGIIYASGTRLLVPLIGLWCIEIIGIGFFTHGNAERFSYLVNWYIFQSLFGSIWCVIHNRILEYRVYRADLAADEKEISDRAGSTGQTGTREPPYQPNGAVHALDTLEAKVRRAEERLKDRRDRSAAVGSQGPDKRLGTETRTPVVPELPKANEIEYKPLFAESVGEEEHTLDISRMEPVFEPTSGKLSFEPAPYMVQDSSPVIEKRDIDAVEPVSPPLAADAVHLWTVEERENAVEPPARLEAVVAESAQAPQQIEHFFQKLGDTVGTSYQQEPFSKPSFDISYPAIEPPDFSFDFSAALQTDFSSPVGSSEKPESKPENPQEEQCHRCGSARHSDFSFCLRCGLSF